ncbi:class II aldolase and Adducin N-terminal domain-containing protein [Mycena capillaripes]|nr:class II aldolase and Adducin N-terminal domain-containing protein [Mycena capillaripes]
MYFTSTLSCFLAGAVFSALVSGEAATNAVGQPAIPAAVKAAAIDLLDASHILHFLDIVDALGHVSVRNPVNSSQFLMSFAIAPALTNSTSIVTYAIKNATAVGVTLSPGASIPNGFSERFIHSEIYSKFPEVNAVVHAHTEAILPFANQPNVPLVAQMSTAPVIGAAAPIFDFSSLPASVLSGDTLSDFLVRNTLLGDALANKFTSGSDVSVVLMANHGMAIRATSIRQAVFNAYYTMQNAKVQFQSILLGGGGGKAPGALNTKQITDSVTTATTALSPRAWNLWTKQVDLDPLYVNNLRNGAPASATGF